MDFRASGDIWRREKILMLLSGYKLQIFQPVE
jgi:hypothetical protein